MRTIVLKSAVLLVVVLTATQLLRYVARLPVVWGNPLVQTKLDHVIAGEYDTVFIGSSRMYRHLDPELFDRLAGRDTYSYNLAGPGFRFPQTYRLCRYLLDQPRAERLRYIVMELDAELAWPARQHLHTKRVVYWYDLPAFLQSAQMVAGSRMSTRSKLGIFRRQFATWVDYLFGVGLGPETLEYFIDRRAHQTQSDTAGLDVAHRRGYRSLEDDVATDSDPKLRERRAQLLEQPQALNVRTEISRDARNEGLRLSTPNSAMLKLYRDLLRRADEHGVELLFLVPPRRGRAYARLLPVLERLPEERRLDVSSPDRFPELYELQYSFDIGHLNEEGSGIFTDAVARQFRERTLRGR